MELWTIEQAAQQTGRTADSLYRGVRSGALPHEVRYGRKLVRPADARAYSPKHGGARPGPRKRKPQDENN